MIKRLLLSIVLGAVAALDGSAGLPADTVPPYRPVTSAYTVGIGTSHLCDTYLTPLHYTGISAELRYERLSAMAFDPDRWVMQLDGRLMLDAADNPARNATMTGLELRLSWAMMRRCRIASVPGLQLFYGGYTDIGGGGLLLARNGNNPAQARAAWTLGPTVMGVWNKRIRRLPVTLRYQARMPLVGAFFSPDYGELYYEIYLGNHSGLAHMAWPANYFRLDNLLSADLHLGNTSLRIGYAADIFSSKINNIVARRVTHLFIIGVTTESITIGRSRGIDPHARIISAIY